MRIIHVGGGGAGTGPTETAAHEKIEAATDENTPVTGRTAYQ